MLMDNAGRKLMEQAVLLSAEKFYRAFNANPLPCSISTLKEGRYVDVNESFMDYYGYTRDEVIGKTRLELNIYADPTQHEEIKQLFARHNVIRNFEYKCRTRSGQILTALLSLDRFDVGEEQCVLGSIIDITKRKQMEEDLRLSEERFFKAFHYNPTPMAIVRFSDDKHIDINKDFEDILGFSRQEVIGRTVYDINLYVDFENFKTFKKQLLEQGYVRNQNVLFRTKFGEIRNILKSGVIVELNGEQCRLLVLNDITDFIKMQEEIARLNRMNLIGEMAAGISHEVRNPLTSIRGFLQLLAKKELYASDRSYFELMIEELDRANSIITEFLSLARNKVVHKKMQNLNKIIEVMRPLIEADAIKTDKNLVMELGEIPDILLDEKEMRQLILNLVHNGLEAMTTPKGRLTVQTFCEGKEVVLAVRDEGTGIDPAVLGKIGTPFFTTKDNGTGLGLATCNSIADRHNARIDIDTGETGTTFYVRFNGQ
jgi:two-component system, sporulation sensor kinase E